MNFAPGGLNLIPDHDFPISMPEFLDVDETGRPISTIVGVGNIHFPDYPNTPPVTLSPEDFLSIEPRKNFYIRSISAPDDHKNLRVRLGGTTGSIKSGPRGGVRERVPTWFDLIWKNPNLLALFTVIAWLVPVLIGSRRLYHEWSGQKK
jgi:hypothetical protein